MVTWFFVVVVVVVFVFVVVVVVVADCCIITVKCSAGKTVIKWQFGQKREGMCEYNERKHAQRKRRGY
jgi:hypothetical protein